MLKDKKQIKEWLDKYFIKNYTINDDLTVDVDGSVNMIDRSLKSIDVQFRTVIGDFECHENELTSLKGSPYYVGRDFCCYMNKLTSLEFCPQTVNGSFNCSTNELTSLKYCPENIGEDFLCSNNPLTTLQYCPKVVARDFYCNDNQLSSLEWCPQSVGRRFYCNNNSEWKNIHRIANFEGIYRMHQVDLIKSLKKSMENSLPVKQGSVLLKRKI